MIIRSGNKGEKVRKEGSLYGFMSYKPYKLRDLDAAI